MAGLLSASAVEGVHAEQTWPLPPSACSAAAYRYADGFENQPRVPQLGSGGSGGMPGSFSRPLSVAGINGGSQIWYGHAPPSIADGRPLPLLIALHGAAGSHALALQAGQGLRDRWSTLSDSEGFIVVAPTSSGNSGGWLAPASPLDHPSDYDVISAALADAESLYAVDLDRVLLWGFSAGAHVAHHLAIRGFAPALDHSQLAAYTAQAGALDALTCVGYGDAGCIGLLAALPRALPVELRVGDSDPLLSEAIQDRNRFVSAGWELGGDLQFETFVGGHVLPDSSQLSDEWSFMCRFARLP